MPQRPASSERANRYFVRRLLSWGRSNLRDFPWRHETEPFRLLVTEVLVQRSRGGTVAKVYVELFRRWPDARSLAEASSEEIEDVIRPLGLVRRAVTLKRMAQQVVEFGGVPTSLDMMLKLSGVGRYAASATAAAAFGQRHPTVDATSARVYRRYFGLRGPKDSYVDDELWDLVDEVSPKRPQKLWNWAVLDLAAKVCLPKNPRCSDCPLRGGCMFGQTRLPPVSDTPGRRITSM